MFPLGNWIPNSEKLALVEEKEKKLFCAVVCLHAFTFLLSEVDGSLLGAPKDETFMPTLTVALASSVL